MKRQHRCSCSRRSFLRGSGLTLAGFGLSSLLPGSFVRHALAQTVNDQRLIFIFLRGGNDGLNAVIPHGDPDYNQSNRFGVWISPTDAIDLNGFASLHPAMADMMDLYNAGDLAMIHRVAYPNASRSHFDGQRVWENGIPDQPKLFEGWLARCVAENAQDFTGDLPGLSAQAGAPVLLRGTSRVFPNISDPEAFYDISGPKQSKLVGSWRQNYARLTDDTGLQPYRPILSRVGLELVDTINEFNSWDVTAWDPKDPDDVTRSLFPVDAASNQVGFSSEAFRFFDYLKISALALLESTGNTNGTRVAGTQLDGFDTHSVQGALGGRHAELLSWLAYGYRSLYIVLSGAAVDTRSYPSIWEKTVVVTMSEFGRTSKTNANHSTDHGSASCMWAGGGAVNGGVYNCDSSTWPGGVMFGVDGRYLHYETDFRAVFWEILRDHMGASPLTVDAVFPGYTAGGLPAQELGLIGA